MVFPQAGKIGRRTASLLALSSSSIPLPALFVYRQPPTPKASHFISPVKSLLQRTGNVKNIEAQKEVVSQQLSHPTGDGNGAKRAPLGETQPTKQTCYTKLIEDIPATSDAFSDQKEKIDGPHQTVANVIASMI